MSDFNTNAPVNNEQTEKAALVIRTRRHAAFLRGAAEARIAKLQAELEKTQAQASEYAALEASLPDVQEAVTKVIQPGATVEFKFGRGESARVLTGVVQARKDNEAGKPTAYRVVAGEGFDAQLYTVQPGSIVKEVGAEAEAPAESAVF